MLLNTFHRLFMWLKCFTKRSSISPSLPFHLQTFKYELSYKHEALNEKTSRLCSRHSALLEVFVFLLVWKQERGEMPFQNNRMKQWKADGGWLPTLYIKLITSAYKWPLGTHSYIKLCLQGSLPWRPSRTWLTSWKKCILNQIMMFFENQTKCLCPELTATASENIFF